MWFDFEDAMPRIITGLVMAEILMDHSRALGRTHAIFGLTHIYLNILDFETGMK